MRSQLGDDVTDLGRPSRRTLAKGAAWTVPVVMAAAPSPAMAVSPRGSGTITASCPAGTGLTATFALAVSGSTDPFITVQFTHTGSGAFSVSAPGTWGAPTGTSPTITYQVPVAAASGSATVTFSGIGQNLTGIVTATISATPPFAGGDQQASVSKLRQGLSGNYTCAVLS